MQNLPITDKNKIVYGNHVVTEEEAAIFYEREGDVTIT